MRRTTSPSTVALGLASVWLVCALVGCAPDAPDGRDAVEITSARRGALELILVEKGRVEAKQTTTVFAPVEAEIVWLCEEGVHVKAGDTVARFANEEIEDLYEDAKAQFEAAERRLARARRGMATQKRELALDVERQQSLLALAKWELADLKEQADERQIRDLETSLEVAECQVQSAKLKADALDALAVGEMAGSEELRVARVKYKRAKTQYERAKALLHDARSTPNRRRIDVADQKVLSAEQNLKHAQLRGEEQTKIAERNLDSLKASLDSSRDRMDYHKSQIEQFDVPAPVGGHVVFFDVYKGGSGDWGERSRIRVGETRWRTGDMFRIADLSTRMIDLSVSEVDAAKVRASQRADVLLLAYPDRQYKGEVTHVSPVGDDKNTKLGSLAQRRHGLAGVRVVEVRIKILDPDDSVRLGLSAQVVIHVGAVRDQLLLPHSAIVYEGESAHCHVWSEGSRERRELTLGRSDDMDVVVLKGLREGEQVVDGVSVIRNP